MRSLLELGGLLIANGSVSGTWPALALAVCLRATLVLAAAALACAGLRRRSAAVRHLVWAAALGGVGVLPLLTWGLPPWGVPVLPGTEPAPRVAAHVAPPAAPALAAIDVPRPALADAGLDRRERSAGEPALAQVTGDAGRARAAVQPWPWTTWLAAAWGCGVVAVLASLLVGQARLAWWKRRAPRMADAPAADLAARLGDWLGLPRRVVLLRGEAATSPMTWGVLRPVVLLPAGAEDWPSERLRAVLLHELAHVKRRDCLVQILAQLACAGYWFHPLAWLAAHRLRIERERACDDLVLEAGATPATDYAAHLLDVARSLRAVPGGLAAAVPMARSSQLEGRLRAILDRSRSHRVLGRRGACVVLAVVGFVVVSLATARLQARASREEPKDEAAAPAQGGDARPARMTVSGRVLDRAGRGIAGAEVALVGRRKLAMLSARAENQYEVLGRTRADAEGRFRLETRRTSSVTHYELHAVATAPGLAMGWAELNRDAPSPSADVTLGSEQVVEGRLVDLQGVPAAGVAVRVSSLGISRPEIGRTDGLSLWQGDLAGLERVWPAPVTTDAEGRFRLKGVGRDLDVGLRVDDPRFAQQGLSVQTNEADGAKQATFALKPVLRVAGRVTCKDTGAPLAGALVEVGSGMNAFNLSTFEYHTDADGRYEANPGLGKYVQVTVYPPVGSPYLIFARKLEGDEGAARRVVDMAVPRGVLITGRITARGSGRPLAGASVYYDNGESNVVDTEGTIPGWMSAVASGADGRYAITVAPGKGYLLCYGPTADFVYEVKGDREISSGKPGGQRHYAHAFVPYDVKAGQDPVASDITLNPGATLTGTVVGPERQTVDRAEIITTLSISPFHTFWRGDFTLPVRDGRFELHGLPPDRAVQCSFLDAKNGWGTTLKLSAAMTDPPPMVMLRPCGTAIARLVDPQGRPAARAALNLHIIGTEGLGKRFDDRPQTEAERSRWVADEEVYANVDRVNYWRSPRSDPQGRLVLPRLIPGATYRIYEYRPDLGKDAFHWRDFTVEPGRTTDLGDVRVKTEGR